MASDRRTQAAIVLSLLAAFCPSALALNPSLDINQYAHTAWTIRDGFKSIIHTIAQTPDGYLWLGTESGLLRFDGVRAVAWRPPGAEDLSDTTVRSLLAAKGMDSEVLKAGGRAGHWGLPGMRERADRLGGKLEFWSEAGAGAEAVLTVPAAAAYGASNGGPFSFLRRKKAGA